MSYNGSTTASNSVSVGSIPTTLANFYAMIVSAAIKFNGLIISLPRPKRHADIIKAIFDINRKILIKPSDQGFLDSDGRFHDRDAAMIVATHYDQLLDPNNTRSELFSEDLW